MHVWWLKKTRFRVEFWLCPENHYYWLKAIFVDFSTVPKTPSLHGNSGEFGAKEVNLILSRVLLAAKSGVQVFRHVRSCAFQSGEPWNQLGSNALVSLRTRPSLTERGNFIIQNSKISSQGSGWRSSLFMQLLWTQNFSISHLHPWNLFWNFSKTYFIISFKCHYFFGWPIRIQHLKGLQKWPPFE